MTKLPCLVLVAAGLGLGGTTALAADGCSDVPELRQAAQRPAVDQLTRDIVDSLLNDVEGMCEDGVTEDLEIKLHHVRNLLEGNVEVPEPQTSE